MAHGQVSPFDCDFCGNANIERIGASCIQKFQYSSHQSDSVPPLIWKNLQWAMLATSMPSCRTPISGLCFPRPCLLPVSQIHAPSISQRHTFFRCRLQHSKVDCSRANSLEAHISFQATICWTWYKRQKTVSHGGPITCMALWTASALLRLKRRLQPGSVTPYTLRSSSPVLLQSSIMNLQETVKIIE